MDWRRLKGRFRGLALDAAADSDAPAALAPHLALGRRGEELAADYLRGHGYRLVASNFKLGVGRNRRGAVVQAEIDLVAYEGSTLCFVEVRRAPPTGSPPRSQR